MENKEVSNQESRDNRHHSEGDVGHQRTAGETTTQADVVICIDEASHAVDEESVNATNNDQESNAIHEDEPDEENAFTVGPRADQLENVSMNVSEQEHTESGSNECLNTGAMDSKDGSVDVSINDERISKGSTILSTENGLQHVDAETESIVMVPEADVHVLPAESRGSGSNEPVESAGCSHLSTHVPIWERLPVATPVFEAEVQVWEFDRPKHKPYFGKGFFGDTDNRQDDPEENDPRTPLFSTLDRANPLRCLGKLIGIALVLPLYLLYKFLTLAWVPMGLRILDRSVARPLGRGVDCLLFLIRNLVWCFYDKLIVSAYKYLLVYPYRIIRNMFLYTLAAVIKGIVWLYESRCCQAVIWSISVSIKSIKNYCIFPLWKGLVAIPSLTLKFLVRPPIEYILKPVWSSLSKGVCFVCKLCKHSIIWLNEKALLPFCRGCGACTSFVVKTTTRCTSTTAKCIHGNILVPFCEGVVSGLSLVHKHLILPLTNCVLFVLKSIKACATTVVKGVYCYVLVPFAQGFTSGLSCMYTRMIAPVIRGGLCLMKATKACVNKVVKGVYCFILVPFAQGFTSGLSCMYKHMISPVIRGGLCLMKATKACVNKVVKGVYYSLLVPVARGFTSGFTCIQNQLVAPATRCVGESLKTVHRNIVLPTGQFICTTLSFIGNAASELGTAVGRVLTASGSAIKGLSLQLGDAVAALVKKIVRLSR